jgi:hypothetical protein
MLNAKRQAEEYARALPTSHGWPPFILVCDVGHCIEVYADFSGQGKNYTQFPDRQTFRIYLEDLRIEEVRERLRKIWLDPASLDPISAPPPIRFAAVTQRCSACLSRPLPIQFRSVASCPSNRQGTGSGGWPVGIDRERIDGTIAVGARADFRSGSKAALTASKWDFCHTSESGPVRTS